MVARYKPQQQVVTNLDTTVLESRKLTQQTEMGSTNAHKIVII
jgi:hypothetical protein